METGTGTAKSFAPMTPPHLSGRAVIFSDGSQSVPLAVAKARADQDRILEKAASLETALAAALKRSGSGSAHDKVTYETLSRLFQEASKELDEASRVAMASHAPFGAAFAQKSANSKALSVFNAGAASTPAVIPVLAVAIPQEPRQIPACVDSFFYTVKAYAETMPPAEAREFIAANLAQFSDQLSSSGGDSAVDSVKNIVRAYASIDMLPSARDLAGEVFKDPKTKATNAAVIRNAGRNASSLLDLSDPMVFIAYMLSMSTENPNSDARKRAVRAIRELFVDGEGASPVLLRKFFSGFDRSDIEPSSVGDLREAIAREIVSEILRDHLSELHPNPTRPAARPFDANVNRGEDDYMKYDEFNGGDDEHHDDAQDRAMASVSRVGLTEHDVLIGHEDLFDGLPEGISNVLEVLRDFDAAAYARLCNDLLDRSANSRYGLTIPSTHRLLAVIRSIFDSVHPGKLVKETSEQIMTSHPGAKSSFLLLTDSADEAEIESRENEGRDAGPDDDFFSAEPVREVQL